MIRYLLTRLLPLLGSAALLFAATVPVSAADKPVRVAFLYVDPVGDSGWSYQHDLARRELERVLGAKVKTTFVENIPATADAERVIRQLAASGNDMIFTTSFGYMEPTLRVAKLFPKVKFGHATGFKTAANMVNYESRFYEGAYRLGVLAGKLTKSNTLGFVGSFPIPEVIRNINAYTLGARSVNPTVETYVVFTGDWSQPTKEAEAAESLVNQGIDVLTSHVDSPKVVIETAEKRGIFSTGYHASQAALAPKGYLTGAEWNWEKVYAAYIDNAKKGVMSDHLVRGGFKEGFIKMSPYGAAVAEDTKKKADEAKARFMDDSFVIYKGPLKNNEGKEVIPAGTELKQRDIQLESMNYLVEGVKGKVN
jgi:basic membrane protein A